MKILRLTSGLLLAGALLVLPLKAQADTVFIGGGLLGPGITTPFVGTNSGDVNQGFTANVVTQVYAPGSGAYASSFTSGSVSPTDYIYAYLITDTFEKPAAGVIDHFSVKSGATIDAIGFVSTGGGVKPSTVAFTNGLIPNATFNFDTLPISLIPNNPQSTIVVFAAAGIPVFQPGTLADGASASSLVVSATGPALIGQPLPLPTSACAGMALLGLLSMGRRRKAKIA